MSNGSDEYKAAQTDRIRRKRTTDTCIEACASLAHQEVETEKMIGKAEKLLARKRKHEILWESILDGMLAH